MDAIGFARAFIGIALALFVPGFLLTRALFKENEVDALEVGLYSIIFSIFLNGALILVMNLVLRIPVNVLTFPIAIIAVCVLLFFYLTKKSF
jgi:uncharacterized membrane protein